MSKLPIVDNHYPKAMEERLEFAYQQMAKDERRESEALEWAEAIFYIAN